MDERYSLGQLDIVDNIIEIIHTKGYIHPQDIIESNYFAYSILEGDWIKVHRYTDGSIYHITKSNKFDAMLAGGTLSDRYNRQAEYQNKPCSVIAINSNVALGNNITQSLELSFFKEAIQQIDTESSFTNDEKEELKVLISELKDISQANSKPRETLRRSIIKWGERLISMGGSIATIIQAFADYLK